MSRLLKTLIFSFLFLLLAVIFPQTISAEPKEFVKAVQEGNNLQWYLGGESGMLATTTDSLLVAIAGARDEQGNLISSGAIQTTSALIASTYQKPASTTQYLAYIMNHSGLAKSAYAQTRGGGWDFLTNTMVAGKNDPVILKLWTISRNITYLFFIIIFIAIGFMIMFRSKLNPQTVVNIQLALPSIVVSLILVTFSFAICGFIVDFVFLGNNLIQALFFEPITGKPLSALIPAGEHYSSIVSRLDIMSALLVPHKDVVGGITSPWKGLAVFDQLADFFTRGLWDSLKSLLGIGGSGNFFSGFIPLIFGFTLLGVGLKIFFALITKYVTLVLSTIFSPFMFLFSAFPGKSEAIGNFLKTMLSAALTFPAVAFMFFLSAYFVSGDTTSSTGGINLVLSGLPPLNKIGILAPGEADIGLSRTLEPLIALGILMATTQVPQALDQMLGVKAGIFGAATPEVGGALRKIPIIGSLLG